MLIRVSVEVVVRWLDDPAKYPAAALATIAITSKEMKVPFLMSSDDWLG